MILIPFVCINFIVLLWNDIGMDTVLRKGYSGPTIFDSPWFILLVVDFIFLIIIISNNIKNPQSLIKGIIVTLFLSADAILMVIIDFYYMHGVNNPIKCILKALQMYSVSFKGTLEMIAFIVIRFLIFLYAITVVWHYLSTRNR